MRVEQCLFLGGLLTLPFVPWASAEPIRAKIAEDPLAACEALMAERPLESGSARCFEQAANAELREEIIRRLETFLREQPENPWLSYHLARVEWPLRTARVPELFEEAARIFERRGDLEGEIDARRGTTRFLALIGRLQEAGEAAERLGGLASRTEDPLLLAKIHLEQARHLVFYAGDLEQALHLLVRDRLLVTDGEDVPYDLERAWLEQISYVTYELDRYEEARDYLEQLLALVREAGNSSAAATTAWRLATVRVAAELPGESNRRQVVELARQALDLAQQSGNRSTEVSTHRLLGRLLGGDEGREHLQACLELTDGEIRASGLRAPCLEALAEAEAAAAVPDPGRVEELLEEASANAEAAGDPWVAISVLQARARVQWALGDREQGTAESLAVLDRIEALRSAQAAEPGRAAVLSVWWEPYQRLAGRLLDAEGRETSRRDLELASRVVERMRARTLLETLGSELAVEMPAAVSEELERVERDKEQLQRQLAVAETEEERRRLEKELTVSEQREADLRHRAATSRPRLLEPTEAFAGLDAVEASLGDDQALLSFQYGLWRDFYGRPDTGSWVVVSTKSGSRAYALADRLEVEPLLEDLLGMDDPETAPELMVFLYEKLLAEALDQLPDTIEHLVIIPDGGLHLLPFALLRPEIPVEASLAAQYRLSFVPSATLWHRWRRSSPAPAEAPALVLADPGTIYQVESEGPGSDAFRGAPLAPLPYARREGRNVARRLGGGSLLRLGPEASEAFLATHPLSRYSLLHFAAHARVVPGHPGRSAVFLAPGGTEEDGWLQPGEIVRLDLSDRLVVLGACDSVAGRVVRGEGVMSLARAFFASGARTVIGSHRPLPDREAARLFEIFYRRLGAGESVGHALAAAQRERLRAGAPSQGWSGLVVLGDADLVPFPGGLPRPWWSNIGWVAVFFILIGLALRLYTERSEQGEVP